MALIAKRAILYGSIMYQPGDVLPASDPAMVEAWLKYGSAANEIPADPADRKGSASDQTNSSDDDDEDDKAVCPACDSEFIVPRWTDPATVVCPECGFNGDDDAGTGANSATVEYTADMKPEELREAGRRYGLTFPIGTTKVEMAEALNAAAAAGSPS
jgi:hypothetical protein